MRPAAAKITLVVVLLGFAALATRVAFTLVEPDLIEQKVAAAQRYIYYRMTAASGPAFQLEPTDTAIRIVTHVVVPPGAYDSAREFEYGIHVVVEGGDKPWQRDIYTRSRQSKARPTKKLWLDENTFVPDGTLELTDDRVLGVSLPALPEGATAKITLLGDFKEGYVRAYSPVAADSVGRRVRDLPDRDRTRIASQTSYVPWDRLQDPDELVELRFTERRLSAEGKEGTDYATRTLFTTGFRLRTVTTVERGLLVTAMHGAAVNVVGPAHIDMAVTRPVAFAAEPGHMDVALVGEGTPPPPIAIDLPAAGARLAHTIDVPAGVFSLTMTATGAARVELASTGATAFGAAAGSPLLPDEQVSSAYTTDASQPIQIAIDGPPDLLSRVLRIDVRALASTPVPATTTGPVVTWPGGTPPPLQVAPLAVSPVEGKLVIDTLDEHGAIIATAVTPFESVPSRFEIAKLFGKLAANVCEPASVRFVVPPGGHAVQIHTDKPALVQVLTPISISPPVDHPEPPYDAVALTKMRWRYARFVDRGWLAMRPADLGPERQAMLAAQARLEPRTVEPPPAVPGTTLPPDGAGERQTVVERVPPEEVADFIAHWDDGRYAKVVAGQATQLNFSAMPSHASIRYRTLDDAALGAKVSIEIDGAMQNDDTFNAARGSLKLPALDGVHAIRLLTTANVELLVDRPPAKGSRADLYALRTIFAVRNIRMKIAKRAPKQNVNIVLYTTAAASEATVHVTIDGGNPSRTSGIGLAQWSIADRIVPLPPADHPATLGFADAAGGKLYPRRVAVSLGDDIPDGNHVIEVSVAGQNVWARFFTLDGAPVAARALQWRESTEEP